MAKDIIAKYPIKIFEEVITLPAMSSEGFAFISRPNQIANITPAGYRFANAVVTAGSHAGIRNDVSFIGLTANLAVAVFYVKQQLAEGTITLNLQFVPIDKINWISA